MRCWLRRREGEVVSAANLNSPDQVVIAGHAEAVQSRDRPGEGRGRAPRGALAGKRAVPTAR